MLACNSSLSEQATIEGLIDIRTCKRREKASRVDNAVFLLEQIGNHRLFRVGDDVVEIGFTNTSKTLSDVLISHFKRQNNKKQV